MKNIKKFVFGGLLPSLAAGLVCYGHSIHMGNNVAVVLTYPDEQEQLTYSKIFQKMGKKIVDSETTADSLKNILLSRMFPNYKGSHVYSENQLFSGSPKITLTGNEIKDGKIKLFIMDKNGEEDANKLRSACISALSQTAENLDREIHKLREWCTVSQVRDVLRGHKFRLASTNEQWKKIIGGE